jgi:hypothetical protein
MTDDGAMMMGHNSAESSYNVLETPPQKATGETEKTHECLSQNNWGSGPKTAKIYFYSSGT